MVGIDNVLVSVIVPVWNVEPYLKRCIKSIQNQSHGFLEIILVDDGSPDRCPVLCDELAARDNRIHVIHKENGGPASARNAGLDAMSGEWVCFIDSDDYIDERYVEALLKAAAKHDAVFAQGKRKNTFRDNDKASQPPEQTQGFDWFSYVIYLDNTPGYSIHSVCQGIYRADLFHGLRFPLIRHTEDTPVNAHIFWKFRHCNFAATNQVVYFYFQSPVSQTRNAQLRILDRYEPIKRLREFWEEKDEPEIRDCYFKLYFTKMVQDYTEMRRDIPELRAKYEHLAAEIYESFPIALSLGLKMVRLPLNAKELFASLQNAKGGLVLFGFGLYCVELHRWLHYYGIDILEVWDWETIGEFSGITVRPPHDGLMNKEHVTIAFTVDGEIAQTHLRKELRALGYRNFISCNSIFGAVKYMRYKEFLPEIDLQLDKLEEQ